MAKRSTRKESTRATPRTKAERLRSIEAGEFRLVDRAGSVRAVLGLARSGPQLAMMHEDGTVAIEVTLTRAGPVVRLMDDGGKTRVFMGATRGAARMGMSDVNGTQRAFLGLSAGGAPALTLYDNRQRRVWTTPQ